MIYPPFFYNHIKILLSYASAATFYTWLSIAVNSIRTTPYYMAVWQNQPPSDYSFKVKPSRHTLYAFVGVNIKEINL